MTIFCPSLSRNADLAPIIETGIQYCNDALFFMSFGMLESYVISEIAETGLRTS